MKNIRLEILKSVAEGKVTPEEAEIKLNNMFEKSASDCVLTVFLDKIGYQMDLVERKAYHEGKIKVLHSECRDYGQPYDIGDFSHKILDFVRKGEEE